MDIQIRFLVLASIFIFAHAGPWVPPAELCLPSSHLKELSGCIAMTDKEEECNGKASDDEQLDCFCTQEMLSSYFDCQSDVQICLESHILDSQFDLKIREWHSTCDDRLTTTMTTPALPTLTKTYDFKACGRLQQSCVSADYETRQCSSKYMRTSSMSFTSCACQPRVYSLCSECSYNGNVSCKRTTAAKSNIWGYSFCSSFWSTSETPASIDLTSYISAAYPLQTGQETMSPTVKPSPTGFITSIAKPTGAGSYKVVVVNAQEEL